MRCTIVRLEYGDNETIGILALDGAIQCYTLELPWRENQKSVSCIPEGIYEAQRINSPKYGETYQVLDVPGRTEILVHVGNTCKDSTGCILLGLQVGQIRYRRAVLSSRLACDNFREATAGYETITIDVRGLKL